MNTKNYVKPITMLIDMWRDVEGTPYEVSVMGEVRNTKTGRILKPVDAGNKYLRVSINKKLVSVHHLVAYNYPEICGEWFEGAEISHLDENSKNNCAFNLRWVDHKTNLNWGTRRTKAVASRLANGNYGQKPVIQYATDGTIVKVWESARKAAISLGFNYGNIKSCARGAKGYETAFGYKWKYVN